MAMETQSSVGAGQDQGSMKFSRYRSVRRAASQTPAAVNTAVPPIPNPPSAPTSSSRNDSEPANDSNAAVTRSVSRYRRQRTPTSPTPTSHPPVPDRVPAYTAPRNGVINAGNYGDKTNRHDLDEEAVRERHRQAAMDSLTGGEKRPVTSAPESRKTTNQEMPVPRTGHGRRNLELQEEHNEIPKRRSLRELMKLSQSKDKSKNQVPATKAVEPVVAHFAGVDAPISAVNAGERWVHVQYKKMAAKIRVTPSTRVQDILVSASSSMTREIDPLKFILMESFQQFGLERSLRRYESVRDVMNSWATDEENSLIIVPSASLDALYLLDAQNVSAEQPSDVTVYMYYSQRPRKWDKRYVTLRSDGQITVSKKENGKEQANVCHLSDFDIYSPTSSFLSNNVKPPKKLCQAIKSQQKSSMFLSTENFVHFFSTNDKEIAETWYMAVQTWRSWYLVTKLGADNSESQENATQQSEGSSNPKRNQPRPLKPLIGRDSFETTDSQEKRSIKAPSVDRMKSTDTKELFSRKKSTREHAPPPSSFSKSFSKEGELPDLASQISDGSPFSSSGLLGRSYSVRQQAMKEREEKERRAHEDPFTPNGLVGVVGTNRQRGGPTSQSNSRSNTMTSARAPDVYDLVKRSQSVNKSKPLVDLTPVYQEPPQHSRKGRGVTVEPGVPLIDAATGPEPTGGIVIPSATTWRRPPVPPEPSSNAEMRTRNRSNTTRSINRHQHTSPNSPTTPVDSLQPLENPFMPNSLLARSAQLATAQNAVPIGHGVATGDRNATKPMLDLTPENPFAEGSLLRNL